MKVGRFLALIAVIYVVIATPWYIPKAPKPQVLGLPVWAVATIFIILALGYFIYYISGKVERVVMSGE